MISTTKLSKYFGASVKERGRGYARAGRVRAIRVENGAIRAIVAGSRDYRVRIRTADDGEPDFECGCSYHLDHGPCKHSWAVVCAYEAMLSGNTDAQKSEPAYDSEDDFKPDWVRALKRITHNSNTIHTPDLLVRIPVDSILFYVIDIEQMKRGGTGLLVELATRPRLPGGGLGALRYNGVDAMIIDHWPDESDRRIVQMLVGTADEHGNNYLRGRRKFSLTSALLPTVLPVIINSGRCVLKPENKTQVGAPLSMDTAGPFDLVFLANDEPHRKLRVVASFVRGPIPLEVIEPVIEPVNTPVIAANGEASATDELEALDEPPPPKPRQQWKESIDIKSANVVLRDGLFIHDNHIRTWRGAQHFELAQVFRDHDEFLVEKKHLTEFIDSLCQLPAMPTIDWPETVRLTTVTMHCVPRLSIKSNDDPARDQASQRITASLHFDYGEKSVRDIDPHTSVFDAENRIVRTRDTVAENAAKVRLETLGLRRRYDPVTQRVSNYSIDPKKLSLLVGTLTGEGWRVEAQGKLYRRAGKMEIKVKSGVDWFDLDAKIEFGEQSVSLPQLLTAMRDNSPTVVLDDGSLGVLPEEWLAKHAGLIQLGEETADGTLRFKASQIGFLDALLSAIPDVDVDERFAAAREKLSLFSGVTAIEPSAGFIGELRPYQAEGLGWLSFLRDFSFGGCLADDMGLGKTIQVLALLESRRSQGMGTSLVVLPRSLVFNWKQEALKFTPAMRVLDQSGVDRIRGTEHLSDYDLVLTTYGTLRRDAGYFKDFEFDYAILDEAQAIKNAGTEAAKAVRLLKSRFRLAMSGTPIENHLGELWSLFEFLNPGMLGAASAFNEISRGNPNPQDELPPEERNYAVNKSTSTINGAGASGLAGVGEESDEGISGGSAGESVDGSADGTGDESADDVRQVVRADIPTPSLRELSSLKDTTIVTENGVTIRPDRDARMLLAKALRPFILRRTKEQVAKELPAKTEQTIFCDLSPEERKMYDDLRDHYRSSLLGSIEQVGIKKSKIQVLEALLRLRQASCHPGLIDPSLINNSSAKLEVLTSQISQAVQEGHKVLVFSQFTSLLAIVKTRLNEESIVFEYLDGKTRDRQERVERFQSDAAVPVFLISLKAGGVGLNLTAADYVFLLDPWWNPAVESQAIDRSHRIGQTKSVFAYRLIARDTVEEKVLQLQSTKRELADAIINADNSLIADLTTEDLRLLLA